MKIKIGEKIKKRRKELGLTQKDVCGEYMTRNMLSLIESDSAMPSIDTAEYIASRLDITLSYLFESEENIIASEKNVKIELIRDSYKERNFEYCMKLIDELGHSDDELDFLYAYSAFEYGKQMVAAGALETAGKYLSQSVERANATSYNTSEIKAAAPLYISVAKNVHSPLLELDSESYEKMHEDAYDYEFFKYITGDYHYEYKNEFFKKHMEAKLLLRHYKYQEALALLKEIEENRINGYNASVMFGVYGDLEYVYKQLADFENAYRYSSKRITMISAFSS